MTSAIDNPVNKPESAGSTYKANNTYADKYLY